MKLKCISNRLNYIVFDENKKPRRVKPGETFQIKAKEMPKKWRGLVTVVEGPAETDDEDDDRVNVTNPENGGQPKTEPAKTEPAKTEPAKTEPAKTAPASKTTTKTQAAKTAAK